MNRASTASLALLLASALAPTARAEEPLTFSLTPYIWLPAVDTGLSVAGAAVPVESSSDVVDIFDSGIDFALLLTGQVRKGRLGLLYDAQFVTFDVDGDPVGNFEPDADVTFFDATLLASYQVIDHDRGNVNLAAGARGLYADVDLTVRSTTSSAVAEGGASKTWVDPIIGIMGTYRFNDAWAVLGYADIGGFGVSSELTYQLLGTVSYSFNEHIALQIGYRYFAVDFEDGPFEFDIKLFGPIIGLTFKF
jgi:opacity protein-like surface antigen